MTATTTTTMMTDSQCDSCNLPHPRKLPSVIGCSFWVTFRSWSYVWCLNCIMTTIRTTQSCPFKTPPPHRFLFENLQIQMKWPEKNYFELCGDHCAKKHKQQKRHDIGFSLFHQSALFLLSFIFSFSWFFFVWKICALEPHLAEIYSSVLSQECRVLKGAGSQLVVSACQHTLVG